MNKETIEIPLLKASYEELQEVICELQVERLVKDKEIERLNNIIDGLEKYLHTICIGDATFEEIGITQSILKKLKKLKEGE